MKIEEIIEEFEFLDDWQERYKFIIDLGKELPDLSDNEKVDLNKVNGCTSQVWLIDDSKPEELSLRGDSDSHIVKGLVFILLSIYNGKSFKEALAIDVEAIFNKLDLKGHLSPNRSNGFFAMVSYIKSIAENHSVNA